MLAGNGVGTVTSNDTFITCGAACAHQYTPASMVTLTAAPDTSSVFTGWSGGGCTGTGTCTLTILAATQVTATFTLKQLVLTVTKSGTGLGTVTSSVGGITCGATCTANINSGTMVTLTASSSDTFVGWTGGGCTGTGTGTLTSPLMTPGVQAGAGKIVITPF